MSPKQNVCSAPLTYESGVYEMKPKYDAKQTVPLCTNDLTVDELYKLLNAKIKKYGKVF